MPDNNGGLKQVTMKTSTMFVILFGTVCAGCFGMEDMVGSSGPGLTLLIILAIPVFWAIPIALVCAELGAAIPEQGGYYVWLRRALGPFWAYCGAFWRTWLWYINSGILIVLAMDYVASFFALSRPMYLLVSAIMIAAIGGFNIISIKTTAWAARIFLILIMIPFGLLVILGIFKMQFNPATPFFNPYNSNAENIAYAIVLGVWMYGAFESPANFAGEVSNFKKIFPKALGLTVLAMTLTYFLPMLVGLSAVGQWELWGTEGGSAINVVELCKAIGGNALGGAMLISAMCSNIIMVTEEIAATPRIPAVLADDGLAPKFFGKLHKKYRTPYLSIIFTCALAFIVIIIGHFSMLIEFQTFVFFGTYAPLMIAAAALRIKEPDLERPYRIPLGTKGLIAYSIPVVVICFYCIIFCSSAAKIGALIFGLGAPLTYFIFKKMYGGYKPDKKIEEDEKSEIEA